MARSFQQRLQACMRDGNLLVADLARWFERPHSTVRTWVAQGREPNGPALDAAFVRARLDQLETRIRKRQGFPIPRLAPRARILHLEALLRGWIKKCG